MELNKPGDKKQYKRNPCGVGNIFLYVQENEFKNKRFQFLKNTTITNGKSRTPNINLQVIIPAYLFNNPSKRGCYKT